MIRRSRRVANIMRNFYTYFPIIFTTMPKKSTIVGVIVICVLQALVIGIYYCNILGVKVR